MKRKKLNPEDETTDHRQKPSNNDATNVSVKTPHVAECAISFEAESENALKERETVTM